MNKKKPKSHPNPWHPPSPWLDSESARLPWWAQGSVEVEASGFAKIQHQEPLDPEFVRELLQAARRILITRTGPKSEPPLRGGMQKNEVIEEVVIYVTAPQPGRRRIRESAAKKAAYIEQIIDWLTGALEISILFPHDLSSEFEKNIPHTLPRKFEKDSIPLVLVMVNPTVDELASLSQETLRKLFDDEVAASRNAN